MKLIRVQLSRKKGWRMPENTVSVARPHQWGNPFTVEEYGREFAVIKFRGLIVHRAQKDPEYLAPLRGKNLACWCGPGACHADVLLEMANKPAGDLERMRLER